MKNDFSLPSQTGEGIDSLVTLYSGPEDHYSHRIRFALNLKGIEFSLEDVPDERNPPEELKLVNPNYAVRPVPTLKDRDLVLYEPGIILSYVNERFPSPPLSPHLAQENARFRMLLWEMETTLVRRMENILMEKNKFRSIHLSHELRARLVNFSIEYLAEDPLADQPRPLDMSDCILAPLLVRLPLLGINLRSNVPKYEPLRKYMKRIFQNKRFLESCSNEELKLLSSLN